MSDHLDTAALENACVLMHNVYESAARSAGWETQTASRKPWSEIPEANKAAMRAAVTALFEHLASAGSRAGGVQDTPAPAEGVTPVQLTMLANVLNGSCAYSEGEISAAHRSLVQGAADAAEIAESLDDALISHLRANRSAVILASEGKAAQERDSPVVTTLGSAGEVPGAQTPHPYRPMWRNGTGPCTSVGCDAPDDHPVHDVPAGETP